MKSTLLFIILLLSQDINGEIVGNGLSVVAPSLLVLRLAVGFLLPQHLKLQGRINFD